MDPLAYLIAHGSGPEVRAIAAVPGRRAGTRLGSMAVGSMAVGSMPVGSMAAPRQWLARMLARRNVGAGSR